MCQNMVAHAVKRDIGDDDAVNFVASTKRDDRRKGKCRTSVPILSAQGEKEFVLHLPPTPTRPPAGPKAQGGRAGGAPASPGCP